MNQKSHYRFGVLPNQTSASQSQYVQNQQSLYKQSLQRSSRKGEVSLAFLSTFMQLEHVQLCGQQNYPHHQPANMTEPQYKEDSPQLYEKARKQSERISVNKFYQTKMKQIEKDERSITALLGTVDCEARPGRRLMTEISQTFERAKTFTTMPVVNKQGLSSRKKQQNSRRMQHAFKDFVSKRSHTEKEAHQPTKLTQSLVNNRLEPQIKKRLIMPKFLKSEKARGRKLISEYVKVEKFTFNEVMSSAKGRKPKTLEMRQFRWTNMGNKHLFNLKPNDH